MYREQIYFPLLLLYVISENVQSSELLQLLFLIRGLRLHFPFFSQSFDITPVAMWSSFASLFVPLTFSFICISTI